jgi:hypothetical protein
MCLWADLTDENHSLFSSNAASTDRATIKLEWIEDVVRYPLKKSFQKDGRIRRWASISEMEGRYFASHLATGC